MCAAVSNPVPPASDAALLPCCLCSCHSPKGPGIEARLNRQPITIALAINCRTTGKTPVRLCVAEDVTTHNLTEEDFFLSEIYDLGKADEIYVRTGFCGGRGRSFPVAYITMAITRKVTRLCPTQTPLIHPHQAHLPTPNPL